MALINHLDNGILFGIWKDSRAPKTLYIERHYFCFNDIRFIWQRL